MRHWCIAALLALFAYVPYAFAHEMRPAYLELTEEGPGEFSVLWKTPMVGDARLALKPAFSGDATPATPVTTRLAAGAAVEALIALSIVFVATEILRARDGGKGIAARAPWIVAFVFGLLHSFGFAGALSEIGLPQGHIPLALLFFNVGVELGQLLFIAAALSFIAVVRRIRFRFPRWITLVPSYAIGSVAMFWVIQRVVAF